MVEEMQNQPDFPLKKIRFEEMKDDKDEDRISRLPDCLLVEILSRLPDTECAVRTNALSKRWKQIWTSVSNLILIHRGDPNADFISFVDKTLTQRGQLKLKKFRICSPYNDRFEPHVRNWIRYGINCNVEELNIDFWHTQRLQWSLLDDSFFINSYLTVLKVSVCHLNPDAAISWEKLLSLHISYVIFNEDLIENILTGCPVLETLKLTECYGYTRLNITSKTVKKLVLDAYMHDSDLIEINTPNILSLKIKGPLYMKKLLLINVSSLIEADLDYKLCAFVERTPKGAEEEEMFNRLMFNLRHVKEVKIGDYCFKILSRLVAKGFSFPSNLKVSDDNRSYPFTDSDYDESSDSEVVLLDDDSSGGELQEIVDDATSNNEDDDDDETDA